ncbi:MAG: MBL fold metallo-hydrolase [Campylobacteraceae bacterium]|nr:MBL fold metallo-hydrolase [Campylobacteraceae bacterium]
MKNKIKKLFLICVSFILVGCSMNYSDVSKEDIKNKNIKITWISGPSMLIDFNGFKILTDPMLGTGKDAFVMGNPNEMFDLKKGPNLKTFTSTVNEINLNTQEIDLVLISHAHEDHFDQKAQKKLPLDTEMLIPLFDKKTILKMGFTNTIVLKADETKIYNFDDSSIRITAVAAHHSKNKDIHSILGEGNGYFIEFKQGAWKKTLYWTGDTFLTDEIKKSIAKLSSIDILVPHVGNVGVHGSLGQLSMKAIDVLEYSLYTKAKNILPIHHSTYDLYLEPITKFEKISEKQDYILNVIKEGETIVYK